MRGLPYGAPHDAPVTGWVVWALFVCTYFNASTLQCTSARESSGRRPQQRIRLYENRDVFTKEGFALQACVQLKQACTEAGAARPACERSQELCKRRLGALFRSVMSRASALLRTLQRLPGMYSHEREQIAVSEQRLGLSKSHDLLNQCA